MPRRVFCFSDFLTNLVLANPSSKGQTICEAIDRKGGSKWENMIT